MYYPPVSIRRLSEQPRRGTVNTSYGDVYTFSYPMYRDFRDGNQVFSGVLAWFRSTASFSSGGTTELVQTNLVSGNYFELLGVKALMGRSITPEDDNKPGAHPVVVDGQSFTDQVDLGSFLVKKYNVRSVKDITSCSTCHR